MHFKNIFTNFLKLKNMNEYISVIMRVVFDNRQIFKKYIVTPLFRFPINEYSHASLSNFLKFF